MLIKCPLRAIREAKGISRRQFALMIGRSTALVSYVENGNSTTLPTSFRPGVEALGAEFDALATSFAEWRHSLGTSLKEAAQLDVAGGPR